jgi:hypothetical protein
MMPFTDVALDHWADVALYRWKGFGWSSDDAINYK